MPDLEKFTKLGVDALTSVWKDVDSAIEAALFMTLFLLSVVLLMNISLSTLRIFHWLFKQLPKQPSTKPEDTSKATEEEKKKVWQSFEDWHKANKLTDERSVQTVSNDRVNGSQPQHIASAFCPTRRHEVCEEEQGCSHGNYKCNKKKCPHCRHNKNKNRNFRRRNFPLVPGSTQSPFDPDCHVDSQVDWKRSMNSRPCMRSTPTPPTRGNIASAGRTCRADFQRERNQVLGSSRKPDAFRNHPFTHHE